MFNSEEERYAIYNRMDFSGYNSLMHSLQSVSSALSTHDDIELLQALGQLSSDLAIAQEDFLATIPLPQLIAVLIQCLHKEAIPDIPLYAMNSLASIVDSLPHASGIIVSSGGISVLSSKLMNFDFIDLAEHSIKVLEKISIEHSVAIVKEGAFENMINTMDFFETSVQKRILTIAVNISKALTSKELLDRIWPQVTIFFRLLEFRGNEGLMQNEKALDFLIYFTDSLVRILSIPEEAAVYFNQLKDQQVVRQIIELISNASSLLVKSLKLLRVTTKHSASMCCEFLSMGGSDVIKEILSKPHENLSLISEILKLANSIIPSVESETPCEIQKLSIYKERPQYLKTLTEMILPRSIAMYEELINSDSKVTVIEILEKLIRLCPEDELRPLVSTSSFSAFISEVLNSKEFKMVENALKIANVLYDKMIDSVITNFIREGVFNRINSLKDPSVIKNIKPPREAISEFPPVLRKFFSHSDMEQSERQIFEELMLRLKNRSQEAAGQGFQGLFPMAPQEPKENIQQVLANLTRSILEKHKTSEKKEAYQPGKDLAKIVKNIETSNGDSAFPTLLKLVNSLASSTSFSYYEVCNSRLSEAILKWLTDKKAPSPEVLLKRLSEFLGLFMKENSSGETHLSVLITLLIGALQYVQHFSISVNSSSIPTRKLSQRHRLQFVYTPDPDTEKVSEFLTRHNLYNEAGHFVIAAGQYTSFDNIKNSILMAKSVRDLGFLRDYFRTSVERRMRMEYFGEYSDEDEYDEFSEERSSQNFSKDPGESIKVSLNMNINGLDITKGMTVYEAISACKNPESAVVKFKLCLVEDEKKHSENYQSTSQFYMHLIDNSNKVGLESKNKAYSYLILLKLFYDVNDSLPMFIPQMFHSACYNKLKTIVFKSSKLTSLLSRQIQDQSSFLQSLHTRFGHDSLPVSGNVPSWIKQLPKTCRFLFPYSVRENYLYSFVIRVPMTKQKVRANRSRLLEDAMSIMRDTSLIKQGSLEIDYEDEVGTGVGPSLEFFSLVSKEIRKLPFWRNSEDSGLFPLPLSACSSNYKEYFNFFGRFVAKALIDKRQIDLPFSPVFWKLVLNEPVTLLDLAKVDKALGQTLIELQEMLTKYRSRKIKPTFKGVSLENLGLVFTLPGFDNIELKPSGKNCYLSCENIEEYINLVTNGTLLQVAQAGAFRQGFEILISPSTLDLFSGDEVEDLLCGQVGIQWNMADLQQFINPAHGYTVSSPVFHNFLITLTEMNLLEQRKFLQFITGSPRLPVGGFSALNPRLTVVRKEPSIPGMHPDEYLPSVMTCQNYLKLPEYSGIEILQRNLRYAINEGHESFHLS